MPTIEFSTFYLPFSDGEPVTITQGVGGSFSHNGRLQYSLDFGLSDGSTVYPIADGTIVSIHNGASDFVPVPGSNGSTIDASFNPLPGAEASMGPGLLGNYVTVRHLMAVEGSEPQEVYVTYAHLSQNSMGSLTVGDSVATNVAIGETGFTGAMFSSNPDGNAAHLHIQYGSTVRPLGDGFIASAVDNEENYPGTTFFDGEAGALSPVDISGAGFVSNAHLADMLLIEASLPGGEFTSVALSDFIDSTVRNVAYLATPINDREGDDTNPTFPDNGVASTISFAEAASYFGVADGSNVAELYLESVLGSSISNVTYTGSEDAAFLVSSFEIPGLNIDFEGGILLSSGGFPGPSNTSDGYTVEHGTPGDAELFDVVTAAFPTAGTTQDAAVLQFDIFIDDPDVDGIRFDIVFGSDEYSEFSDTDFVDVAAVWVDDDRDGAFEVDENKALFNGNLNTPLSVITANLALNLVDNEIGELTTVGSEYPIEWDGFGSLVVRPSLQQGMNSIKIAVADTGDMSLDSGIYVTNFEFLTGGATSDVPLNVLNGQAGQNDLFASDRNDEINLAAGQGSVSGTLNELSNDIITGFTTQIELIYEAIEFLRSQLSVFSGSAILEVDSDQDGVSDSTVTLEGDFSGGDFMAVRDNGDTIVTFETFLPLLQERQEVDPELVNGIINQNFLKGDGSTDFRVTLEDLGFAGYDNVVGVYEVDEDGNIIDTRILFENANADKSAEVIITDVEAGNYLGFFIVQDAADWASTLSSGDMLSFVNSSGETANVSDGADIAIAVNDLAVDEVVFHSFDEAMNSDGVQHALSGVDVGGESITVGFEDLTGGGDRDYEDVVFQIEIIDDFVFV